MAMKIVRIAFCLSILLIVTSAAVTAHARTVSTDDEGGMSTGGMPRLESACRFDYRKHSFQHRWPSHPASRVQDIRHGHSISLKS